MDRGHDHERNGDQEAPRPARASRQAIDAAVNRVRVDK
jgi:hypothetical protein